MPETARPSTSVARQNFSVQSEEGLRDQINAELTASYTYRAMAAFFDRDDVALPGFCNFFRKSYQEESEHAQIFIDYLNRRGGRFVPQPIEAPKTEWTGPLEALEDSLALEKKVNKCLIQLRNVSDAASDPEMTHFIDNKFLPEQVEANKELADMIAQVKRVGDGLGVYMFDKSLQQ